MNTGAKMQFMNVDIMNAARKWYHDADVKILWRMSSA